MHRVLSLCPEDRVPKRGEGISLLFLRRALSREKFRTSGKQRNGPARKALSAVKWVAPPRNVRRRTRALSLPSEAPVACVHRDIEGSQGADGRGASRSACRSALVPDLPARRAAILSPTNSAFSADLTPRPNACARHCIGSANLFKGPCYALSGRQIMQITRTARRSGLSRKWRRVQVLLSICA